MIDRRLVTCWFNFRWEKMLLDLAMLVLLIGLFGLCAGLVRFADKVIAPLD